MCMWKVKSLGNVLIASITSNEDERPTSRNCLQELLHETPEQFAKEAAAEKEKNGDYERYAPRVRVSSSSWGIEELLSSTARE